MSEEEIVRAALHLDTQHNVGSIDPRIFGGFLEHLGRAVYEGVYDPGSRLSDEQGFRRDVIEALRPLRMPVMRYPGGNFVSCYNWRDGIGPREKRPVRLDYAWKSVESNQFGTDEFMAWCEMAGTAPMLAINLGTGSTAEAAALLEYCNFPAGTAWADRRKRNGHAEPYGVKLWCLGNEMDGEWQAGHVPAEVYAQRAWQAGVLMKGLDPSIETVICGSSHERMPTYMEWDRTVLEHCWDKIDYISAHRYSQNTHDDSAWFLAEGTVIDRVLTDYAGLLDYVRAVKKSNKRVYLSFDEWNVWYRARAGSHTDGDWTRAPHLLEEAYNLEDALVCAQYLLSFIRRADLVKVACLAQIVNVIAPIMTHPDGLLRQTIYHAIALIAQHAAGVSLVPVVQGPTYVAGTRGETPVLDAAASYDQAAGTAAFLLVNRHQHEQLDVAVKVVDRPIKCVLAARSLGGGDVKAINTWDQPDGVTPVSAQAAVDDAGTLHVTVPAPGLTVVHTQLAA
jgi:alpha-N-arabinofuranosidase